MNNHKILNKNFSNDKFYLLDLARTIAALSVVLQHYQHFYFVAENSYQQGFERSLQPFYRILEPLYSFGSVAVQFFFVLSGFIFFLIYKDRIYSKKINFENFVILRISRLYPLHLLTLCIVALLQGFHIYFNNEFFIHKSNDIKNFILHLFLIQEWGFNTKWGFNAPAWSISVEILLYITFFFLAKKTLHNIFQVFLSVIGLFIIYILIQPSITNLLVGFLCFYIGGLTFFIYKNIIIYISKKIINKFIIVFIILLLDIIIFGRFLNPFFIQVTDHLKFLIGERIFLLLFFIKFPLIILNLALLQNIFPDLGRSFHLFGAISYTVYLVHFPVEIIFSLINNNIYNLNFSASYIFITYLFSVFLISYLIFIFYENPLKELIRSKFFLKNLKT
jgi:peptidoglycan/LPS O-acetylase OafA/YrhL